MKEFKVTHIKLYQDAGSVSSFPTNEMNRISEEGWELVSAHYLSGESMMVTSPTILLIWSRGKDK